MWADFHNGIYRKFGKIWENTDSEEINRKLKNYLIKSAKNLYQLEKNDKKSTPMTKNPYK